MIGSVYFLYFICKFINIGNVRNSTNSTFIVHNVEFTALSTNKSEQNTPGNTGHKKFKVSILKNIYFHHANDRKYSIGL